MHEVKEVDEWMEETTILKRSFRSIATIAGIINQNVIGSQQNRKHMSVNSDLIYDVLKRHQPNHFLLKATYEDAAKGLTDIRRLSRMLIKFENKIEVKTLEKISPFAVPIMLEIGRESIKGKTDDYLLKELENEMISELEI